MKLSKKQLRIVYVGLGLFAVLALVNPSYSSAEVSTPNGRMKVEKYGFGPGRMFEHTSSRIVADEGTIQMDVR